MTIKPLFDAFRDYISLKDDELTREWFDRFDWNLSERNLAPVAVPATNELSEVLGYCGKGEEKLVRLFVQMREQLQWLRSYDASDFGQHMVDHYGHVEIFGTRGHYVSKDIAAGIVFFGRGVDYPNHWHAAEEIYYPLTNSGLWSQDEGPHVTRKSGQMIHHESNERHAMKVPDAPLLALWIWRGGDLAQKGNY